MITDGHWRRMFKRSKPSMERRGYRGDGTYAVLCDRHGRRDPHQGLKLVAVGVPRCRRVETQGCPLCRREAKGGAR